MIDIAASNQVRGSVRAMVNFTGISLESDEIVAFLGQTLQLRSLCQQIMYQRVVTRSAAERQLSVTAAEIQEEANRLRYELRLESAARTLEWLEEQLVTPELWEMGIRDRLLSEKLRETLFAQEVERVFVQSRLDFEQISLYRIRVPYYPLAQELFYQIEEAEISFYEAAHLYDMDEQRRLRCGYEGRLHRWDFEPDVAAVVFGATVGEVLGPFLVSQSYDLLMVNEIVAPELNEENRNIILERLFKEWLERELNYWIHTRESE